MVSNLIRRTQFCEVLAPSSSQFRNKQTFYTTGLDFFFYLFFLYIIIITRHMTGYAPV